MATIDQVVLRRVKRRDRWARWVITAGGAAVIASVITILALIVWKAFPLFTPATSRQIAGFDLPKEFQGQLPLAVGVDLVEMDKAAGSNSVTAYTVSPRGEVGFFDLGAAASTSHATETFQRLGVKKLDPPGDKAATIVRASTVERPFGGGSNSLFTLEWSDGGVPLAKVEVDSRFDEHGKRHVTYAATTVAALPPGNGPRPTRSVMRPVGENSFVCAQLLPDNTVAFVRQVSKENLLGETETQTQRSLVKDGLPGEVTALTLTGDGSRLFVGTRDGKLGRWEFDDAGKVTFHENVVAFNDDREITTMAIVFGDVSLVVGDKSGAVTVWFEIRGDEQRHLREIRPLATFDRPVRAIIPSPRDKSVLSVDDGGEVSLDFMTTGRHLLRLKAPTPLAHVGYSPRGNAVIGLGEDDRFIIWQIDAPHADVSLGSLFGTVQYEGYEKPEYKWQSEGIEPKHSVVPLIFGTIKATIYAMLFAAPLSLFGAIYVSHFTTPVFKRVIKPVVEIMAALPSVVIGFLILLWAGPLLSDWIVAFFTALVTIPLVFVAFMALWQMLRRYDWAKHIEHGYEFIMLAPVICLGVFLAAWLGPPLENLLFAGSFKQWLYQATGSQYEPLNALVVALGLGFAVIPIIFSISEDALSSIPQSLSAASLALGASRWQTLWRVVLPSASPGIFAAVMIGFGRAVGETMIVFMAAGNTPILDWSMFNGFRTLSANIAVEMPEATVDGSLYRILFLCAVILFVMTFLLNTAAEVVRQRLRKRFGRY